MGWPEPCRLICASGLSRRLRMACRAARRRFGSGLARRVRSAGGSGRCARVARAQAARRRPSLGSRIDAHGDVIRAAVAETPDMTLEELQAMLRGHGLSFGIGTLWRFFDRHKITRKKRPRTPPSRTGPTS